MNAAQRAQAKGYLERLSSGWAVVELDSAPVKSVADLIQYSKKTPLRRNTFGGVLSGPVWIPKIYNGREKTFWFFNYEGSRKMSIAHSGIDSLIAQVDSLIVARRRA